METKEITRLDLAKGATIFKQGHYETLAFTPRNADGEVVDLTGKTINVVIVKGRSILYDTTGTFDSLDNTIQFDIAENFGYGDMWMEITVTDPNDTSYRQKFPTSEYDGKLKFIRSTDDADYVGFSGKTVAMFEADQVEFKNKVQQDFDIAVAAVSPDAEVALARKEYTTLGLRLDAEKQETAAQLADIAVSVKSFAHLVVNGDWRAAIQAAIDSIPHGKVILHQNVAIANTVNLKSNIALDFMGYKMLSIEGFPANNMMLSANGSNISIENFFLEGHEGNKVRGIQSTLSDYIAIKNGYFKNLGFYGLLLANHSNWVTTDLTFEEVANNSLDLSDPYISGAFRNDFATKGYFSNIKFIKVYGKALSFSYSSDCTGDVVDIREVGKSNDGANGSGIYINYGSDNITIKNVVTQKTGVTAIKVSRGAKNIVIEKGVITCSDIDASGIDFYAVILQGAENTKFIDCVFKLDMARYGVQIVNHEETGDVSKDNQFINCDFFNTNATQASVVINQESGYGTVLDNTTIQSVGYAINCGTDTIIKNGSVIRSTGNTARAVTCKDRTEIIDSKVFGGERGVNLSGAKDVKILRSDIEGGIYGVSFASGVERADISYTKVKSVSHALFGGNPINSEFKFNDLLSTSGLSVSVSSSAVGNKFLFNNMPKNHNIVSAGNANVLANNFTS